MKFKAVIFDLDGTLLDTLLDLAHCMNIVLMQNGFPARPIENYKYYVGEGMDMLVRNVMHDLPYNDEIHAKLLEGMREIYGKNWHIRTRPYIGILPLLDKLSEKGIKLNVLSNKPHDFTVAMVKYYFPEVDFKEVFGARENKPKKPDPESALEITAALACAPAEVLFLGDTRIDMQTAVNAGNFPIGVLWGFRPAEELQENGAKLLINTPDELLSIIE